MEIVIKNNTSNDLTVSFFSKNSSIQIDSQNTKVLFLDRADKFKVELMKTKITTKEKIFSYIIGSIVAFFLGVFCYFQVELLKDTLKFPVVFEFLPHKKTEKIIIELLEAPTNEICMAKINDTFLKSSVILSFEELDYQKQLYHESNTVILFVPTLVIFLISVITFIHFRTVVALFIIISVNLILLVPFLFCFFSNKRTYEKFCLLIDATNKQTDNTGDGTVC